MAKHAGKLGALQFLWAVPVGVASRVALGDRCVGLRDSTYTGLDLGRNAMLSYDRAADGGSARTVVDRLMAIARQGGAISSPGTLRGHPVVSRVVDGERRRREVGEGTCKGTNGFGHDLGA